MNTNYFDIEDIISRLFEKKHRVPCLTLLAENHGIMFSAYGSRFNHQAWRGGYLDYVRECLNIALVLYDSLSRMRPLPFPLSSALLVLFLHDLEKPWRDELRASPRSLTELVTKEQRHQFRLMQIALYKIELNQEEMKALVFVEGEGEAYSPHLRRMNELAAFCNMVDVASARIWHDRPHLHENEWGRRHVSA